MQDSERYKQWCSLVTAESRFTRPQYQCRQTMCVQTPEFDLDTRPQLQCHQHIKPGEHTFYNHNLPVNTHK